VWLPLQVEKTVEFELLFSSIKNKILAFEGCLHLDLLKDSGLSGDYFTYSIWRSQQDLERYMSSAFFAEIWPQAKACFRNRAKAWSLHKV
jgi:quinol monooxygenase YgiN